MGECQLANLHARLLQPYEDMHARSRCFCRFFKALTVTSCGESTPAGALRFYALLCIHCQCRVTAQRTGAPASALGGGMC